MAADLTYFGSVLYELVTVHTLTTIRRSCCAHGYIMNYQVYSLHTIFTTKGYAPLHAVENNQLNLLPDFKLVCLCPL